MDELFEQAKKLVQKFANQGYINAQAMVEYEECNEKISKIGRYIAEHGRNKEQLKQIQEFLNSMNNLFDEFIKDLD